MQNQRTIFYLIILATAVFGLLSACSPAEPEAPALTATPQLDSPALQSVDDTAAPVAPTPIPATGSDQTTGSTENTTTDAYPNEAYPAEVFAPPLPQTVREPYPAGVPQELTARNATPTAYPPSGANRTSDLGGAVDSELAGVRAISLEVIETFPFQLVLTVDGSHADSCWQVAKATQTREDSTLYVAVMASLPQDADCAAQVTPFQLIYMLDIGGLPQGTYTVDVNGVVEEFTLPVDNFTQ